MRLINADTVLTFQTYDEQYEEWHEVRLTIEEALDKFSNEGCPNAVDPVKYGHWVRNDNGTYSCSKCYSWIPDEQHYYARYCLFCGAKMDEVEDGKTV